MAIIAEAFLPKVDGVSKTAYLTVRYLQQTGREVLVLAPDIAIETLGPSRVIPMPSLGLWMAPETRVALPHPAVNRHLHEFRPDIVHLFSPALMSFNATIAAHRMGIPVIANYQTDIPGYAQQYGFPFLARPAREWMKFIHNSCHLTLAPSQATASQLKQWGYKRLRIWGRGVNAQRFNPMRRSDRWRKKLLNGRDENALLCVYAGRLANEKQIELLIDVAKLEGVALTIIGDGARREELEQYFAGTQTYFTGYLFGDDLAEALASADVFLFTGPNETFGQVVQEAMASGLPVIVIDAGGVADLVQEGVTGYKCPPEPQAFAEKVQLLRDNPSLRLQLSEQARAFALTRPWSHIMAQLESYYSEALRLNERYQRIFQKSPPMIPAKGV